MRNKLIVVLFLFSTHFVYAHEGMWLPILIEQQILTEMKQAGCKLTAEQIYSVNKASLKDAVVRIGSGCSGGFLSNQGLVITNHHCVQYFINQASNVANNYLEKGFWAYSQGEELVIKGLSVSVLLEMRDISQLILRKGDDTLSFSELQIEQDKRIKKIIETVQLEQPKIECSVEAFWGGNQYFLFISRTYTDIRFVGFPPVNMGAFGGDTDNWEWPRHSADFALLRVYADSSGLPQSYAATNIPLQPRKSLTIDANGVKKGDFTMVMGYPASTNNYAISFEIEATYKYLNPMQIHLRSLRMAPIQTYMSQSEDAYLQYYSKYEKLSNYYKKWQGEQYGIGKSNAIERAQLLEQEMQIWILKDSIRTKKYANLLSDYRKAYQQYFSVYYALMTYVESYWKMDFFGFGERYIAMYDNPEKALITIQKYSNDYFTKNNMNIEKQSFPKVMIALDTLLAPHYLPIQYASLSNEQRKQYIQTIVQNSVLFSQEKNSELLNKLFKEQNKKTAIKINLLLNSDPGIVFVKQTLQHISNTLYRDYLITLHNLDSIQQQYFTCLFEYKGQKLAPDANRTMRVSFGNVLPYKTADAVTYYSQTTSYGIQQKWNSGVKDYKYNARLDSLLQQKQYGSFSNDTLYINFAATNHTSGGNSGSPVLNAYGNFIGLNFDRNKEGTMSDFYFDEQFCRNISVDVQYILFCIEKYGNAYNILQELEFVNH